MAQATASFKAFNAVALTLVDAGLALIIISSPVNGFVPFLASRAGLIILLNLIPNEGTENSPDPPVLK